MRTEKIALVTLLLTMFALGEAKAVPINVSGWDAEGTGIWNVESDGNGVLQTLNAMPTVFHNGTDSQGLMLSGTIEVQTGFDDDFIGFVLGYQAGDLDSLNPDYLLIDWRQNAQTFGCGTAQAGLSIARVTGAIADFGNSACKDGMGVDELARGATLGAIGWEDLVEYTFDLIFTESLVQVLVNDSLELSVAGTFSNGAFGFYNSSQEQVRYAGIAEDEAVIVPVPEPGTLALFGIGLLGMGFARQRTKT